MPTLTEINHYELSDSVPFSSRPESVCRIPFRFWPWSEEWPMTQRELLCIFSHKGELGKTCSFVVRISPYDVVVHRHEWLFLGIVLAHNPSPSLIFWISKRTCNVVNPRKIIHSNSIGSPSIPSNSLYCFESMNISIWLSILRLIQGTGGLSQDTTQSLRIHKLLPLRN